MIGECIAAALKGRRGAVERLLSITAVYRRFAVDPPFPGGCHRTRTHSWDDPSATAGAAQGKSGLEFPSALSRGNVAPPPIMSTLGFEGFEVGPGWARFTLTPGEHHWSAAAHLLPLGHESAGEVEHGHV